MICRFHSQITQIFIIIPLFVTNMKGQLEPKIVSKPWGKELWYIVNEDYALKKLCINKGHRFSLQYHNEKEETWYILQGKLIVTYENEQYEATPGQCIHVPPKTIHRLESLDYSEIIEVSTIQLEDMVRLEDDYHRK